MERALKYHISFILNKSLSEYSIISGCILKRMKISYSFGIVDLLHYGHINVLSIAKKNSDYHEQSKPY